MLTKQELNKTVELHALWLKGDERGARAYLSGANLKNTNLANANLEGAYLSGANLQGADLIGTKLRSANLQGADLTGAYLRSRYLKSASLEGASLEGAKSLHQGDPELLKAVATTILNDPTSLDMSSWHNACGTTHCLAGWAVALAESGKELEDKLGTPEAGRQLLGDVAATHFYDSKEDAITFLKGVLD